MGGGGGREPKRAEGRHKGAGWDIKRWERRRYKVSGKRVGGRGNKRRPGFLRSVPNLRKDQAVRVDSNKTTGISLKLKANIELWY